MHRRHAVNNNKRNDIIHAIPRIDARPIAETSHARTHTRTNTRVCS
jgi:hypothetical protein